MIRTKEMLEPTHEQMPEWWEEPTLIKEDIIPEWLIEAEFHNRCLRELEIEIAQFEADKAQKARIMSRNLNNSELNKAFQQKN